MKLWKGKGQDDCQNGSTKVAKEERHESWYLPVFALAYDDVEVATELVTLAEFISKKKFWKIRILKEDKI